MDRTIKVIFWIMPFAWVSLWMNEYYPCFIWPVLLIGGSFGAAVWCAVKNWQDENEEQERIRRLENFYEEHKKVE